jgi:hypothetical protein
MNLKKLERYLRVNLLGPGPLSYKKKSLPGRGLTKVEKHCLRGYVSSQNKRYWSVGSCSNPQIVIT